MRIFIAYILAIWAFGCGAEDLGSRNRTIQPDRDAREQMKDVLREKQRSGEMDKFWQNFRDRNIDAIKNPAPLGIATNYGPRVEVHDLKFTLPSDYKNEKGQIVARRGTVIEPLKIQPLLTGLIFIDGRDQAQVDYAIAQGRKQRLKIVLTAGSPYYLRIKYKDAMWNGSRTIPFYFDQRKMIINQLAMLYGIHVNSVPAKLFQSGEQLRIEFGMSK
ncbi:MAG: conjugal transfer protein [Herbaspirillum sp.]|nr:conjugal transfer protein [Herbaspirillum sp.]|tara:strand:+ start:5156 stop:5806 length:651 start_codon:yes stop_codon:yes gene_type:complete